MSDVKHALVITKNDFTARRDGGSKRTAALVDELVSAGWEVTWVACRPTAVSRPEPTHRLSDVSGALAVLGRSVRLFSLSALKWFSFRSALVLTRLTRANRYDAVFLEHAQLAAYLPTSGCIRIANMHNVESELLENYAKSETGITRKVLAHFEARRMRGVESQLVAAVDVISTVSSHDEAEIVRRYPNATGRTVVASNGVDEAFFSVDGPRDQSTVFIGHLGWRPNVDAVKWFVSNVWPLALTLDGRLKLKIVGRSPDRSVITSASPTVSVHGDVPSVLPYLSAASCATAPLLSAGGTRIKILEALASGTPVVATTLGALGLEHLKGPFLEITDDPAEFAQAVSRMSLSTPPRAEVRSLVEGFRWSTVLAPLIDAVESARGGIRD